jgi:hypothetical protein
MVNVSICIQSPRALNLTQGCIHGVPGSHLDYRLFHNTSGKIAWILLWSVKSEFKSEKLQIRLRARTLYFLTSARS